MANEIQIINTEDNKDNKSEIDNVIMPTGNLKFLNNYKINKNNISLKNIKSKISINSLKDNINNKLFSNLILKDLIIEEKKYNTLKPCILKRINNSAFIIQNKTYKNNNIIIKNNFTIKKSSIKFYKKTKSKEKIFKRNKKFEKIFKYNFLQKKLISKKMPNIQDINCDNNSFSIHFEKNNNLTNLQVNNRLYSSIDSIAIIKGKNSNLMNKRKSFIYEKKIKNNSVNNNHNLIELDILNKMKNSSSTSCFSNLLSSQNSILNNTRNLNKEFLTPRTSYSNNNYLPNSSINNKSQYNKIRPFNKTLLNDYNNISNLFHIKKDYDNKNETNYKKLEVINNYNINKAKNFSYIENSKNKNENNKKVLSLDSKDNNTPQNLIKSSSLIINRNKTYKNKRVKSSYIKQNKFNLEYINSFQNKQLNTKFINLKNYKIKENIISNILADIEENKSINNNLVSEIYKRPLINIFTLLDLKNNDVKK